MCMSLPGQGSIRVFQQCIESSSFGQGLVHARQGSKLQQDASGPLLYTGCTTTKHCQQFWQGWLDTWACLFYRDLQRLPVGLLKMAGTRTSLGHISKPSATLYLANAMPKNQVAAVQCHLEVFNAAINIACSSSMHALPSDSVRLSFVTAFTSSQASSLP